MFAKHSNYNSANLTATLVTPREGYMKSYIHYNGPIDRHSIESMLKALQRPETPRTMLIDSNGGTFHFFSTLAPAIARQGITTVSGDVRSAAVLLFLLGHRRYALPDSTFFFHEVRAMTSFGAITVCNLEDAMEMEEYMEAEHRENLEQWRHQMRAAQGWFTDYVSQKINMSPGTITTLMRNNTTLDARDALRYGIVHEIMPYPQE